MPPHAMFFGDRSPVTILRKGVKEIVFNRVSTQGQTLEMCAGGRHYCLFILVLSH